MIEIVHYMNRAGRKMVAVFAEYQNNFWVVKAYQDRYHAGLEKPHYPLPVCLRDTDVFTTQYAIQLFVQFIKHWNRT